MADLSLHDYAPLLLKFRVDANSPDPSDVIGRVLCKNLDSLTTFKVFLLLTPTGNVFCGDEDSPDQPIRFVNTTTAAFSRFIKAHADYTNDTIYHCQLDGRGEFKSRFLRGIGTLVDQFHEIDPAAIADRDYWWPYTLDPILAEYLCRTT